MIVAIRSEIDSRPLVYPMIRVLKNYGSICFISSNKQCRRLLGNEDEGGFRNIRVIIEEDGALDSVYSDNGITPSDFDFIILDNMGLIDYDILFVPVGENSSVEFQEEIDLFKTDSKVRFVQFGGSAKSKKSKPSSGSKSSKPSRNGRKKGPSEEDDMSPEERFALVQTLDEEFNVAERYHNVSWPTWKEIEDFESLHYFMKPEKGLADVIYKEFTNVIAIDKRTYDKEVQREDPIETGNIDSVPTDIESPSKKGASKPSQRRQVRQPVQEEPVQTNPRQRRREVAQESPKRLSARERAALRNQR